MNERFKQLKENITEMKVTDLDLKGKIETEDAKINGKIATIEATDVALEGKIDTKYTELEEKLNATDYAELKKNLSVVIPDYNKLVESK
jgi:predicted acetyltransferase